MISTSQNTWCPGAGSVPPCSSSPESNRRSQLPSCLADPWPGSLMPAHSFYHLVGIPWLPLCIWQHIILFYFPLSFLLLFWFVFFLLFHYMFICYSYTHKPTLNLALALQLSIENDISPFTIVSSIIFIAWSSSSSTRIDEPDSKYFRFCRNLLKLLRQLL